MPTATINPATKVATSPVITAINAVLIAENVLPWLTETKKDCRRIPASLVNLIKEAGGTAAFMTKEGMHADRVVSADFFGEPVQHEDVRIYRNAHDAANAVWLEPGQAFVDVISVGSLMYLARGRDLGFAGRYTSRTPVRIKDSFRVRGIPREEVHVTCLFDVPNERKLSAAARFERDCSLIGIDSFESLCPVPRNGAFFHNQHPDPTAASKRALGICVRRE